MKKIVIVITIVSLFLITACSTQSEPQSSETSKEAANEYLDYPTEEPSEDRPIESVSVDSSQRPDEVEPIYDENEIRYISNSTDKLVYDSLDELNKDADFVVTGACISSKPVFQNNIVYTLSEFKIDSIFRGDLTKGDTILIIEMGGRTTYGEYNKNCPGEKKAFETGDPMPSDYQMVTGIDGFFPLKEGEQVLLFLADSTGFIKSIEQQVFGIWGAYDGKLFLQPDGVTYARPLPSNNDKIEFGEDTLKITVDELKEKIGKEKPAAE
jgi:hypothetical protein